MSTIRAATFDLMAGVKRGEAESNTAILLATYLRDTTLIDYHHPIRLRQELKLVGAENNCLPLEISLEALIEQMPFDVVVFDF